MSGLSGTYKKSANEIYKILLPGKSEETLNAVEVNRLYAVTLGDLVSHYANKVYKRGEQIAFVSNGLWNDLSCPTSYALTENNGRYVTNSVLRGAIDGETFDIFTMSFLRVLMNICWRPKSCDNDAYE
ncbi:hypothetical protein AVEN_233800-1 [Araneus ventricosus]|uniref:Uncharacterized protein n=1 Tax=Araneus ventricosus TaxID=182803 RepID=A0A4Y2KGK3_ARAVE|nr:hypothetical protein AVEN_95905-1 [Araneus ventricosus]GBN01058.1 hypothetical protein AVEN_233800-1 [Araneus ventricosus]